MKVLLKTDVLDTLQKELEMTDQEFADYIGISRSQLWRAKRSPRDKRFSLGQDFIAKTLGRFPEHAFEDIFFLEHVSHECDENSA